jgi:hypothetical protein
MRNLNGGSSLVSAFAWLFLGCSAATQHAYIAPTGQTITSDTEERQSEPPVHTIFVENHSTVPVTVFSVSLTACQNVKQSCRPTPVTLHVPPGGRMVAMRVEPSSTLQGFSYRFGFSWRADSSGTTQALAALAAGGDSAAREKLAYIQRADSIRRAESGPHYPELTRDDLAALAGRIRSLRADPESVVVSPGEQTSIQRIRLLVVDDQGHIAGQTRWFRFATASQSSQSAVKFVPPDRLIAQRPGRALVRFSLTSDIETLLTAPVNEVEVPIVVAFRFDEQTPVIGGRAVDADSKRPLACVRVTLEDSAQNVVSIDRTARTGEFMLPAPRPGTYRVRLDLHGWAPAYGPAYAAAAGEQNEHEYLIRFTEQLLVARDTRTISDFQHAYPAAVRTEAIGPKGAAASTPIVQGVTLGGSESTPILGIVSRVPPATIWMQFVVDSVGHVDTASIVLPPATPANMKASIASVMPRVRFSPAREAGTPTCEMLRMQVNFSPR